MEQEECSAIQFDTARPALWNIPVPTDGTVSNSPPLVGCGMKGCQADLEFQSSNDTSGSSGHRAVELWHGFVLLAMLSLLWSL